MTSSSRISGGGLKKCMPTTRVGSAAAGRDRGDRDRRRVRGEHGRGRDLRERPEQLALDLERLGRGLDDELAAGEVLERGRALEPSRAAAASSALQRPRSAPRSRCCGMRSSARSTAAASASKSSVRAPDSAPSCAIPDPIVPAPTTPMTFGAPLMRANANANADGRPPRVDSPGGGPVRADHARDRRRAARRAAPARPVRPRLGGQAARLAPDPLRRGRGAERDRRLDQMREAINSRRRARGQDELTEDEVNERAWREDLRVAARPPRRVRVRALWSAAAAAASTSPAPCRRGPRGPGGHAPPGGARGDRGGRGRVLHRRPRRRRDAALRARQRDGPAVAARDRERAGRQGRRAARLAAADDARQDDRHDGARRRLRGRRDGRRGRPSPPGVEEMRHARRTNEIPYALLEAGREDGAAWVAAARAAIDALLTARRSAAA